MPTKDKTARARRDAMYTKLKTINLPAYYDAVARAAALCLAMRATLEQSAEIEAAMVSQALGIYDRVNDDRAKAAGQ